MDEKEHFLITTDDNPYDPFTEERQWRAFDEQKGYYTWNLIARLCLASTAMSDEEYDREVEIAIDKVINMHGGKNYRRAYPKTGKKAEND